MGDHSFGLLTVLGSHEGELEADRADVHMVVRGTAFLSGDMGITTIREAEELTAELKRLGVHEDEIHVYSIAVEVNSRIVGKSSSATCQMRVHCTSLARLPAILLSVSARKHASVNHVEWGYTFPAEVQAEWLALAIRQAETKAQRSAQELGINIVGIEHVREGWTDTTSNPSRPWRQSAGDGNLYSSISFTPEIHLGQSMRVTMKAELVYRISQPEVDQSEAVNRVNP